ncbi:uncharacterized protein Triagg1_2455 [Trichoderma aggressivum f. europaeum]|uniref:Uncharacterized protein n=1 Tax=Trichoderma aggressivum f. europaeum TaxID=173218 RepID=A0AAE1IJ66_9HYPO|nr:hypothetical protein Triagg1_2455 [Trichoderma aggressivum f. europaeum]
MANLKSFAQAVTPMDDPTSTKKRNRNTFEQDDDGDSNNDPNANGPPTTKPKHQGCSFCTHDPQGRQMAQVRACNYQRLANGDIIECENCADYRSAHPEKDHKCDPLEPLPKDNGKVWRRYGVHDPPTYPTKACDQCIKSGKPNQCNVDSILNYACTATKACKDGHCTINGRKLEKPPKSHVLGKPPWTRTECQCCEQMTKRGIATIGCSWLEDRRHREQHCWNCRVRNLACLNGGSLIAEPRVLTLPKTWNVSPAHEFGFVDCRRKDTDRRMCRRCLKDKRCHCHADAGSYRHACNRCAQLGLDCIDSDNDACYPIFDLARVGIGLHLPFVQCSCCIKKGRNCDLQRPCDSCVEHGDECDAFKGDTAKYCINGRLHPRPGPLYYLALGYGARGVNDVKDGSAVEHWVGPLTSIYGMIPERQNRQLVASFAADLREKLFAYGKPPHGVLAQDGVVFGPTSRITKEDIAAWINSQFRQLHPIRDYPGYPDYIKAASNFVQNLRSGMPRHLLVEQFPSNEPKSFTRGPDHGECCLVDVAGNVGAHGLAVAALNLISPGSGPAQAPNPLNDDAMTCIPMPMDIDDDNTNDAMGYIYANGNQNQSQDQNIVNQGARALSVDNSQWFNPHFDFTTAAPPDQATPVVNFNSDLPVNMDLDFGQNIYPSPCAPAASLNPYQMAGASSDFNADFDNYLNLNSHHYPVEDPDLGFLASLELDPPGFLVDEQDRDANIDPRLRTEYVDFNPLPVRATNVDTDLNKDSMSRDIALFMSILDEEASSTPLLFQGIPQPEEAAPADDNLPGSNEAEP